MNPNTKRFSLIEGNGHDALSAYKQTAMDIFLKRVTPSQEEFQASRSGGFPEKNIVI